MTLQPAPDLAHSETIQMHMVDDVPLLRCKLYVGHGGLLLGVGRWHSLHYPTPTVSALLAN